MSRHIYYISTSIICTYPTWSAWENIINLYGYKARPATPGNTMGPKALWCLIMIFTTPEYYDFLVTNDLSFTSTKTKHVKLNTKTQFFLITLDFCIHFERENFFSPFVVFSPLSKCIKKVVKFSFKRQKIFWVLVFSFMYLVLVDAMDRS